MALGHPSHADLESGISGPNSSAEKIQNLIFVGQPAIGSEAKMVKPIADHKRHDFLVYLYECLKRSFGGMTAFVQSRSGKIVRTQNLLKKAHELARSKFSKSVKYFKSLHKLSFINGKTKLLKGF